MGTTSLLAGALRRLEGKVAIVTGAASGIGETTARLFSKHGAKVILADIQDELGHKLSNELDSASAPFVHCDVTNEEHIENTVNVAVSKYGKLDIMFNNAGTCDRNPNILESTKADFEKVIGVNLIGAFLGTKHAARVMIPARQGCIISTASICSITGGASTHAYTSSKHGLVGLMKNTAAELGQYGIRVNSVSPYIVNTSMTKEIVDLVENGAFPNHSTLKDAVLKAEDIAEAVLYLASNESKYVNGHNLVVDGGFNIVNKGFCLYPLPW